MSKSLMSFAMALIICALGSISAQAASKSVKIVSASVESIDLLDKNHHLVKAVKQSDLDFPLKATDVGGGLYRTNIGGSVYYLIARQVRVEYNDSSLSIPVKCGGDAINSHATAAVRGLGEACQ